MKHRIIIPFNLIIALAILTSPAISFSQNYPPRPSPGTYILDHADVIDEDMEYQINQLCLEVDEQTTAQMAVLTLSTTEGVPISYYATELGNRWGVGQSETDNGLVMVVAIEDRQVFTASGSGMEVILTDARIDQIYRQVLVPAFRAETYGQGIYAALQLYATEIEKHYQVEFSGTEGAPVLAEEDSVSLLDHLCFYFFIMFWASTFVVMILNIIAAIGRKKGKTGGFWSSFGSSSGSGFSSGGFSSGGFGGGSFSGGGGGGGW